MSSAEGAGPPGLPGPRTGQDQGPSEGPIGAGGPPAPPSPGGLPPGYPPPPGYGSVRPTPPPDVAGGEQNGRRAALAIWVGLGATVVQTVCAMITFPATKEAIEQLADVLDDISAGRTPVQPASSTAADPLFVLASLISQVGSIAFLIVGIVFLIWFHKAISNARGLGLRQSHTPAMGVAGFIIPFVNLWFPYQSMRDLFPAEHPARSKVGWWWASYLGAAFASMVAVAGSFFAPALGWAVSIVVIGLYAYAAISVRSLIAESTSAHRQLAEEQGWPLEFAAAYSPPGYPPAPGYPPGGYLTPSYPPAGNGAPPDPAAPPKDPWGRT